MTTHPLNRRVAVPGLTPPRVWWRRRLAARRQSGRQCERLAAQLEHIVKEAHEPAIELTTAIPVRRDEVRATESLILELAARLRSHGTESEVRLSVTKRLLTDGTGPLFAPSRPGALQDAVERAILALDDARAETT